MEYKDVFAWTYKDPLWENYNFCNWGCNYNFELYQTLVTLGIYITWMLLDMLHELQELHQTPWYCIWYHIYNAIHMQMDATCSHLLSMSPFRTNPNGQTINQHGFSSDFQQMMSISTHCNSLTTILQLH
jgi:hypothetical protein